MILTHGRAAALVFALGATALPAHAEDYANPHLLRTVDELAALVDAAPTDAAADGDMVIIDVRTAEEYAGGHIPGAVHLAPDAVTLDGLYTGPDGRELRWTYHRSALPSVRSRRSRSVPCSP